MQRLRPIRGFTLIEMSIVLVIIGLIVGGILVGQDLVRAAEVRAQITQIEKYNAAVNTFKSKFNAIPGDMQLSTAQQFGFVTTGCNGSQGHRDGNGLIDGGGGINTMPQGGNETGLFWVDLSSVNLIDGQYPNGDIFISCSSAPSGSVSNFLPSAKIGYGNFVYVYESNGANWFSVSNVVSISCCISEAGITVSQAYAIDSKIDDGIPTTGNVKALYGFGNNAVPVAADSYWHDTGATCYNTSTSAGVYSITYNNGSGANCVLSFKFN